MRLTALKPAMILGVAALTLLQAPFAPPTASAQPAVSQGSTDSPNSCDSTSWTAGVTNICGGTVVYRDYLYDDYGADTDLVASNTCPIPNPATLPAGDQRYAAGGENTADLQQLRIEVAQDRLLITFTLNTLYDASSTSAALAIDSDNNPITGGGNWPALQVSSKGWDQAAVFKAGDPGVTVDVDSNTITGSMPKPSGTSWRLQAVAAKADGTVMNAAFRGPDEVGTWFEDHQAAALASGDITEFGYTVQVADLATNSTRVTAIGPGLHQRVYRSAYTLAGGEGMSYEGIQGKDGSSVLGQKFNFFGAYQPYAVYVPDTPGPHGVQLVLHGACDAMTAYVGKAHFQQEFGQARNRILVTPLGRGAIGWYQGPSERDVLDVLHDAEAAYHPDTSRVIVSGYSMGGYGALRFATLYPDRFAGLVQWVGYTDCLNGVPYVGNCPAIYGANFNPTNFVRNLRWVPAGMLYAGADVLVHSPSAIALQQAFAATGYPYTSWMHPAAEHGTFGILDDWRKEAIYSASWTRMENPPRVTYRYDPSLDEHTYGLVHDRAYWVSNLTTSGVGAGEVDLTTQGCGVSLPLTQPTNGVGTDPVPWVSDGSIATGSAPLLRQNRLTGTLNNTRGLLVDVKATCLKSSGIRYDITTDGPATIHFSDGGQLQLPGVGRYQGQLK